MKKILVPTDFSPSSRDALTVATALAKISGAELFLLHLERVMSLVHATGSMEEEQVRNSRNQLFSLADSTEKTGIAVHTIFVEDSGLETIEDYVVPYGIDLIIMGSHGQTGIRDQIIGSNTKRLVRKVAIPVLVIKSLQNSEISFSRILFASAFRSEIKNQLAFLRDFAKINKSNVHFLFLNQFYHLIHEEQINRLVEDHRKIFGETPTFKSVVETNDDFQGVSEFIRNLPVDLVAVVMEHSGILGRWLNPPLAERLIQDLDMPVLILPSSVSG